MTETPMLVLACLAGVGLGALFFGGLWWTVRRAMASTRPALWFTFSLFLRMGVTLLGFYVVSAGHGPRMLACLIGFTASRAATTWLTRTRPGPAKGVSHAAQS